MRGRAREAQGSLPALPPSARRGLLAWYRDHRRDLPWRRSRDPYRIWVSEVMLQQTTVKAVTPYYEAFVQRFPNVESLAHASLDSVLALWSGLGYYRRAHSLWRGAGMVAERQGGQFPKDLESAREIPGIGHYTASAILSIAHGLPLAAVDGNIRRVLARLFCLRGEAWRGDAAFQALADRLLDRRAPGEWNQALMELGAVVCTPRNPRCESCPLRRFCEARASGLTLELPERRARREPKDVRVQVAFVERQDRVLLVRRDSGRLLSRLWELPQTSLDAASGDLRREALANHGLDLELGPLVTRARHTVTHRRIQVEGYRATLRGNSRLRPERMRFVPWADLSSYPMSSLTRKLLRALTESGQPPRL